jgi:hypothetical protein
MQLKKHITLLLAILVLVSNSGLAFNVHFCEDKIASITSVFSKEEVCAIPEKEKETCCAKLEKTHKKCCSDKEVNFKNKTEKVVVKSFFDVDLFLFSITKKELFYASYFISKKVEKTTYNNDANAPPLYLLFSQFTFYA